MNIVHINLAMGYTEGMNYQENCVSRYHAEAGHKVSVLTTPYCFTNGEWGPCQTETDYINPHGVHVIRLPFLLKLPYWINKQVGLFKGTYQLLEQEKPDIICVHNTQFQDLRTIVKYKKKHPEVKIFVDNHADFSNSARNWVTKNILYRFWWKPCTQTIVKYTEKFFGVMPSRVDFMVDIYGIDRERCELLYMGAEDEYVQAAIRPEKRAEIRARFGIKPDEFLVMTGGKIDAFKTQTILLMEAVKQIDCDKLKLVIFGSIDAALKDKVESLCDGDKIKYVGWAKGNESYDFFAAADLVVFPGRHSVYWEQVAGLGIPMICKYWDGTTHVDLGGNTEFLYEDATSEIKRKIEEVIFDQGKYNHMKEVALTKGMETFSYRRISEQAIGL